jgi:hypothetical protein
MWNLARETWKEVAMAKNDLPPDWKKLYSARAWEPSLVDVPPMTCLMIDGQGNPTASLAYTQAVETLY